MAKNYTTKGSGISVTKIMIGVIVVVAALGTYAVYGQIADEIKQKRIESHNARISELADSMLMETDEFLECYGLKDSGLTAKDNEQDAYKKMSFKNYLKFNQAEMTDEEFAAFKEAFGMAEDLTMDSDSEELKGAYETYVQFQHQQAEQQAEQQNADADVPEGIEMPEGAEIADDAASADIETDTAE